MTGFGFKTQAQADEIYASVHNRSDEWGPYVVQFIDRPGDTTAVYGRWHLSAATRYTNLSVGG